MKKRVLSVLLSLVMVVGLLPTAALASAPTGATEGAIEEKTVTVIKELNFLAEPQYIKLTHGQTAGEWLTNLKAHGNLRAAEGNGWKVVDVMRVRRASGKTVLKDTDTFDKSTDYCVEVQIALTDSTRYDWQSSGMQYAIAVNGDTYTRVPLNVNYTSVFLYLKFDYVIDEVKLDVTAPEAGQTPSTTATPKGEGYTVSSVSWYEKGEYDAGRRNQVTSFESGKSYVAYITVSPKAGYRFMTGTPLTATVNDTHTAAGSMGGNNASFSVVFPASGGNVTFHPNGGSGTMADEQALSSLPECTFTAPDGKAFDGWSLKPNGDKLTSAPSINGKSITLFARWKNTAETTTVNTVKNFYFAAEPSKIKITNGKDIDEWLAELKSSGNFRAANSADGWEVEEIHSVNDGTEKHKTNPGDKFDTSHAYYMTVQLRATGSNVLLPMNGTKIGLYVNGDEHYNSPMGVKSLVQVYLRDEETISNASVTVPAPSVSASPDSIEPTVPTDAGYTATILAWYEKTSYGAGGRNQVTAFEGGKSYVPFIQLTAAEGYYFPTGATMKVNGNAPVEVSGSTDVVSGFGPAILCPTQDLSGTVTYTGAARYGATLTANVTDAPTTATLSYQWQIRANVGGGDTWMDISGATGKTYGPTDTTGDMVNKDIRVKVSAEGYLGSIYGAAKTVTKDVCYAIPVAPVLSYDSGTIRVTNPQDNQEYYWTTDDPGTGTKTWPKDGGVDVTTNLTDNSFTGSTGTTYYVYTRVKETNAKRAGEIVRTGSIFIPVASSDIYTPATGLVYPDYPTTPRTIYVPVNGTATVNYQITPAGANNNLPEWDERPIGENKILSGVSAENGVLTIKAGSTAGNAEVVAYKKDSTHNDGNLFGTGADAGYKISVTVYDPNNLASTITNYTNTDLETVELYKGDTHTLDLDDLKDTLNFLPAGISRDGYKLKAYILKTGSGFGAVPTFETTGDYIRIEPDTGKITATNYAEGNETNVYLAVLAPGETTANPSKYAAMLTVKVKQNNISLESITVNPTSLTLRVGDTFNLALTKTPEDATDAITWSVSPTTGVVSVDSNGKVTADATGTATITATSNTDSSITATCTVTVKKAHDGTHTVTYSNQGTYHTWSCQETGCGATGVEAHTYSAWTAVTGTDTHKRTCVCGAVETANHSWAVDSTATSVPVGSVAYKCETCSATKTVTLTAIANAPLTVTAPVRDAAPADAATTESTFYVAYTTWYPDVSGTFAAGTVYSVQIDLEAFSGNYYFTDSTNFTINGNAPTSTYIDPAGEMASLTYTFPATGSGSSGSSGGGGGSYTPSYAITVESTKNGDVTVSPKSASKGATVTVTVAPDKGYDLETLTVLDKDGKEIKLTDKGNGKYTFTMPASKVTVKGTFMEDNTMLNFFVDVPADAYYYDAVLWAAKEGITGGVDAVHFAPNAACTRAQIVTFLWRAAGCPEPKAASSFSDVSADAYYAKAVAWAVENGITGGIGGNKFAPDLTCTRAQAVTFLYRAAGSPAVSGGAEFSDVSAEAYYANAVAWAAANGITGGIGGGLFGSNNDCTRAQIVTFLYRSVK